MVKETPVIGPLVFPSQDYESVYLPLPPPPPFFVCLFVFSLSSCTVSWILVPRPGMEPVPP